MSVTTMWIVSFGAVFLLFLSPTTVYAFVVQCLKCFFKNLYKLNITSELYSDSLIGTENHQTSLHFT